jgi:hypothetical protein
LLVLISEGNPQEKANAAFTLQGLARFNSDARVSIAEAAGIPALISLLRCEQFTYWCAVVALRYILDEGSEVLVKQLVEAGGLSPLAELVTANESETNEHTAKIFRLASLDHSADRRQVMADARCVSALATLLCHGNLSCKIHASHALSNLLNCRWCARCESDVLTCAINEQFNHEMSSSSTKFLPPLVQVLTCDSSDSEFSSCHALVYCLVAGGDPVAKWIVETDCIETLKKHISCQTMLLDAYGPIGFLQRLCWTQQASDAVFRAGFLVPTMSAIRAALDNASMEVGPSGPGLLAGFARVPEHCEELKKSGSLLLLVDIIRSKRVARSAIANALFALGRLFYQMTFEWRKTILSTGLFASLAEVLSTEPETAWETANRNSVILSIVNNVLKPDPSPDCSLFLETSLAEMSAVGLDSLIEGVVRTGNLDEKKAAEEFLENTRKIRTTFQRFETSHFKRLYDECQPPEKMHKLLSALDEFLDKALERDDPSADRGSFFLALQNESIKATVERGDLSEVQAIATRLWSSTLRSKHGRELCSYINQAIRDDSPDTLEHLVIVVRAINELCVQGRSIGHIKWPEANTCFRGAGLPDKQRFFFRPGKKYRVPFFLATSFEKTKVAQAIFANQAQAKGLPPVLYIFHLNAEFRCVHVNFLGEKSLCNESEFLFAPYSVFTLRSVEWQSDPTWQSPHIIQLEVAVDNKAEPENLPLATWH